MFNVRAYQNADYGMIYMWWHEQSEPAPLPGMMVKDGTFVLEIDEVPSMSLTVFLTQANVAYFEGFIARPGLEKFVRREAGTVLWHHCFEYAKNNNKRYVFCYANEPKLVERYQELGMTISGDPELIAMYRVLGG